MLGRRQLLVDHVIYSCKAARSDRNQAGDTLKQSWKCMALLVSGGTQSSFPGHVHFHVGWEGPLLHSIF